jgi:hypothetical protein
LLYRFQGCHAGRKLSLQVLSLQRHCPDLILNLPNLLLAILQDE